MVLVGMIMFTSESAYMFSLKNKFYRISPSECLIDEINSINNVKNDDILNEEVIISPFSFRDVVYQEKNSLKKSNDWVHCNIIINPMHDVSYVLNKIKCIINAFEHYFAGITIGLRFLEDSLLNFDFINKLFISFKYFREKHIEMYPYIYLKETIFSHEICNLIFENKCCWELQLNYRNKLIDDINKDDFKQKYYSIKTCTGYNNKGIHAFYNPNEDTYLNMFMSLYHIGYGYPISIDIDDREIDLKDIDKIFSQYEDFIDFLLSCISNLNFGPLFSFFSGRSKLANLIKTITEFPDKSSRPNNLLFEPIVDEDGNMYYNSIMITDIGKISDSDGNIDFSLINFLNSQLFNNSNTCKKCNYNQTCPNILSDRMSFFETKAFLINNNSCVLFKKLFNLSIYFTHQSLKINSDALIYACKSHW